MSNPVNSNVRKIDTNLFDETINSFKSSINKYRESRELVFDSTEKLLLKWEGEGEKSFKNAYDILKMKLKDEEDNLRTISQNLESIRQAYIDWDSSVANQINK